jgi:hypothetical protein
VLDVIELCPDAEQIRQHDSHIPEPAMYEIRDTSDIRGERHAAAMFANETSGACAPNFAAAHRQGAQSSVNYGNEFAVGILLSTVNNVNRVGAC